jgi:uncharacterized protein YjiS (DUF1127 family)
METIMTLRVHASMPPSIAAARAARSAYLAKFLRIACKRVARSIARYFERAALARQFDREMAVLMQADDRMLRDIGLTRAEVITAANDGWFAPGRVIAAAARRREQAMTAPAARSALRRVAAPQLVPRDENLLPVETANFR